MNRRKIFLRTLFSAFLGFLLIFFVWQFVDLKEAVKNLKELTLFKVAILFLLALVSSALAALRWGLVLKAQTGSFPLSFSKLFSIFLAGFPIAYTLPSFGISGQIGRMYLASRAYLSKELAIASLALEYFIRFLVNCGAIVLGVFIISLKGFPQLQSMLLAIFLFISLIFLALFFFWGKIPRSFIRFKAPIQEAFSQRRGWLMVAIGISILIIFLSIFQVYVAAAFLKIPLTWLQILAVVIVAVFLGLIPSPMALGTLEASGVFSFVLLGLSATDGLTLALTLRIQDLLTALTGLGFLFFLLTRREKAN